MSSDHRKEYKRARRRFMLTIYALSLAAYAGGTALIGAQITGWWLFGLYAGVVAIEFFLWINVGLPRAVQRGSEEFKRAYYGEEGAP